MSNTSNDIRPKVLEQFAGRQPSSIVVEYKEIDTILRGVALFLFMLVVMVFGDGFTNILAIILFVITGIVSFIWIRRGLIGTALVLTDEGFRFQNQRTISWNKVNYVYFKEVVLDAVGYRLIIQTAAKNYKIDLRDLAIGMDELGHWIAHFRKESALKKTKP